MTTEKTIRALAQVSATNKRTLEDVTVNTDNCTLIGTVEKNESGKVVNTDFRVNANGYEGQQGHISINADMYADNLKELIPEIIQGLADVINSENEKV